MKKLFLALVLVAGLGKFASAQTAAAKPAVTTKTSVAVQRPAAAKVTATAHPVKADGTPDMRYKSNKAKLAATVAAGPKKADGTPDMRYKANKATVKPAVKKN